MKRIKRNLKRLWNLIEQPEMKVMPGDLAFYMVLSIIPIITLIAYVTSLFKVPISSSLGQLQGVLPRDVLEILLSVVNGEGLNLTFGISMLVIFFLASNGTHSIIIVSNSMYGVKHSNIVNRRIKSLLIIVILILLIVFNLVVIGFGNYIVEWLLQLKFLAPVSNALYQLFILLKWPIALLFIFFLVKLIYTIAPDAKIPSEYTNKGAMFTTILWSIATVIYSFYVTNFNNYNLFYGSLANIIVMMIWFYIIAYILVLGIAINVSDYQASLENQEKGE